MGLIAIGDIHGHLAKLDDVLAQLDPGADDHLVFIGDYIDRGPDTPGVIERLLALAGDISCTFLRGNHEQMLLEARGSFDADFATKPIMPNVAEVWFYNGGQVTLAQYRSLGARPASWWDAIPETHWEFLASTLFEHAEPSALFVHAGFPIPGLVYEGEFPGADPRLWIREPFLTKDFDFGRLVVHGHTPTRDGKPEVRPGRIDIDTGAAYDGPLTAVRIFDDHLEFIQSAASSRGTR